MKKIILFLLLAILLATIGLSWPKSLSFFYSKPDLLLIFAVALVFYLDLKTALVLGVFAGLLKDSFLPGNFGINAVSFCIWIYCAYRLSRQISTKENYVRLSIIFAAAMLHNAVLGVNVVIAGNIVPAGIFLRNLIITAVYTTLLSPLVFKLADLITL
jgi:rod shape-determining protein MreD